MKKTSIEIPPSFKGDIRQDAEILEKFSEDTSIFKIKPSLVVQPKDVYDLNTLSEEDHQDTVKHLAAVTTVKAKEAEGLQNADLKVVKCLLSDVFQN